MAARRAFGLETSKRVVAAALEIPEGAGSVQGIDSDKRLKLVDAQIYGTTTRLLFDSGAILNVLSMDLCKKLHLTPGKKPRGLRWATVKRLLPLANHWAYR